jgi:hypothetical protein
VPLGQLPARGAPRAVYRRHHSRRLGTRTNTQRRSCNSTSNRHRHYISAKWSTFHGTTYAGTHICSRAGEEANCASSRRFE